MDYKSSKIIDKLSDEGRQNIQFVLSTGDIVYLTFYYSINCNAWFVNVEYKDFVLNGLQVVYSDNILNQYSNILPFGIQVDSVNGLSPYTLNSFKDGINSVIINEFL